MYIESVKFIWHEDKRKSNIRKHGLDFSLARKVFEGTTFTFEDCRFDYGEQRYVTIGLLDDAVVGHRAYRDHRGNSDNFYAEGE